MDIDEKPIGKLKGYRFLVPSYQRGYRWTKDEVRALLDDIMEFPIEGDKKYCIQPLIVKKLKDKEGEIYEVVDGQQRLTTIYIFMKIAEQEIRSAKPPFALEYATREGSRDFLTKLSDDTCHDRSNIDYYYMGEAYQTMNQWLDAQPDKSVAIQKMNTKIRESVFFIWYEIPSESNSISVFTKVNLGKIPLSNAELIKALLLNKDNFESDIYKRQIEISLAWDRIEQGLHKDSFWYFLNEAERSGTRIDLLFDMLAEDYNKELPVSQEKGQENFPFLVFYAALEGAENRQQFVAGLWSKVERLNDDLWEWYEDLDRYHIIGYLISTGTSISRIRSLTSGKRKSDVTKALLKEAWIKYEDLEKLSLDAYESKRRIRRLLLLFNIATLVCKGEKQYRFPFNIYKKEKWDIEHIHATADETDEPDDSMGNLALLDCHTNRSYKAVTFPEKRRYIIEHESKGLFVPLCTKNVFMKVYSKNLDDMDSWNEKDKEDYVSEMRGTLDAFFKGVK